SSVCAYSPAYASSSASAGRYAGTNSSLASPSSTLSIGHYKPITPSSLSSTSTYIPKSSYNSLSRYSTSNVSASTNRYSTFYTNNESTADLLDRYSSSSSSSSTAPMNRTSSARSLSSSSSSGISSVSSYLLSNSSASSTASSSASAYASSSSPLSSTPSTRTLTLPSSSKYSREHSQYGSNKYEARTGAARRVSPPGDLARGLTNLGNTCYMNAVLQALYSIDAFRSLILRSCGKSLCNELRNLFRKMRIDSDTDCNYTSSYSDSVSPSEFRQSFARAHARHKSFAGFGQHDAQEFLRYLVSACHDELNVASPSTCSSNNTEIASADEAWRSYRRRVDDSALVDLFVGQLRSTIECSECSNRSHCWDPFWDLALSLGSSNNSLGGSYSSRSTLLSSATSSKVSSVADALALFCAKETLDDNERPYCSRCCRATRATKLITIERAPRVLVLQLKKFTNDGYKLHSSALTVENRLQLETTGGRHVDYSLRSCISHHGYSATSGHYTCTSCYGDTRWFHFNDSSVHEVNDCDTELEFRDAYVLFYVRDSESTATASSRL
ncbi:Ubiquitin carboxyl-terminal hydrolase 2, partial [Fragariocoptes setiger]